MSHEDDLDARISKSLATLGNPIRLRILRALRQPQGLASIRVEGQRSDARRIVSRQTVRAHLDLLLSSGLANAVATHPESGTKTYVVDHSALFVLAEEVKELARLRPGLQADVPTARWDPQAPSPAQQAHLELVRGLDEGRRFPLLAGRDARWFIGRRRQCEIALDYDPFVSAENSLISAADGRFVVADLGGRNGTRVNGERVPSDRPRTLRHGDLVEVGRSALLFRSG